MCPVYVCARVLLPVAMRRPTTPRSYQQWYIRTPPSSPVCSFPPTQRRYRQISRPWVINWSYLSDPRGQITLSSHDGGYVGIVCRPGLACHWPWEVICFCMAPLGVLCSLGVRGPACLVSISLSSPPWLGLSMWYIRVGGFGAVFYLVFGSMPCQHASHSPLCAVFSPGPPSSPPFAIHRSLSWFWSNW